jgi:hypothetical protein
MAMGSFGVIQGANMAMIKRIPNIVEHMGITF